MHETARGEPAPHFEERIQGARKKRNKGNNVGQLGGKVCVGDVCCMCACDKHRHEVMSAREGGKKREGRK